MDPTYQAHFDQFQDDFSSIAHALETGEPLTLALATRALPLRQQEAESSRQERCKRAFNAYAFVFKNSAAFTNLHMLQNVGTQGTRVEPNLMFALHLFFGTGDLFLDKEPQLGLVIDAAIQGPDGLRQ